MIQPFKPEPVNSKELSLRAKKEPEAYEQLYYRFIRAGEAYTTKDMFLEGKSVPMPYFRKEISITKPLSKAVLYVSALGLYEVYLNGRNITKGCLAPYRANPDYYVYCDVYDVKGLLSDGKNALGFLMGSGLQSSVHPKWRWFNSAWKGPVAVAFLFVLTYEDGTEEKILSDESVKSHPSEITFSDYHVGEWCDARNEIIGWNMPEFDDSSWKNAEKVSRPRGELRVCEAEPIRMFEELSPKEIIPGEDGSYYYDFGVNTAGVCTLSGDFEAGQEITLLHFERLLDGKPFTERIMVHNPEILLQEDRYIARGGASSWTPKFTYHGFRYVQVTGITEAQAKPGLLTLHVMHSDVDKLGDFHCSSEMVNRLQDATLRADLSNLFCFPTDCPHREKHGWTGDAMLSAEQFFYNFNPGLSYREWLRTVYTSMTKDGRLPGIIPTCGTVYDWGNGPAWDGAIFELPYQTYRFTGDTQIIREAVAPWMRYLTCLYEMRDDDGLLNFGLGDWCDISQPELFCSTPVKLTDSIIAATLARKAETLLRVIGKAAFADFAGRFADEMTDAVRRELIDHERLLAYGETMSGQAMALYYGMFTESEQEGAYQQLLRLIHEADDHYTKGILGARVIFRVLAEHGDAELAYRMITRTDAPSYGWMIAQGATALWEELAPVIPPRGDENHHMWGDISAWFYRYLAGIRVNDDLQNVNSAVVSPCFLRKIDFAEGSHKFPAGNLSVRWEREGAAILLTVDAKNIRTEIRLPKGYVFEDGSSVVAQRDHKVNYTVFADK